jgi:hypothetical protein
LQFINNGSLFTNFHLAYWMGLSTSAWPIFKWNDPLVIGAWRVLGTEQLAACMGCNTAQPDRLALRCAGPTGTSYRHYGTYMDGDTGRSTGEPYNKEAPDSNCIVANSTMAYAAGPNATQAPWGWAAANCSKSFVFVCRTSCEPAVRHLCLASLVLPLPAC